MTFNFKKLKLGRRIFGSNQNIASIYY